MKEQEEEIINAIKGQTSLFLLDAQEFYPFATAINKKNEVVPISAYLENEHESSLELIKHLEKALDKGLSNGDYKNVALTINVYVKKSGILYDAIEIRFYKIDKSRHSRYFRYIIKERSVEYFDA